MYAREVKSQGFRGRTVPLRGGDLRSGVEHDTRHITKSVAGSGRLRRPSTQPAFWPAEPGNSISVGVVAEPGNRMIEAGSATAGALGAMPRLSGLELTGRGTEYYTSIREI